MSDNKINAVAENEESVNDLIHQQEFGVRLRSARESAGYSIAEVAELLKLSEPVIRALENSQVDKLPPATFTQGYIRSYARLLKLPADEVIDAYSQVLPEEKELRSTRANIPAESRSGDFGFKFFSYLLLLGGLVLLALWWQQSELDLLNPLSPDAETTTIEQTEQDRIQPAEFLANEANNEVNGEQAPDQPVPDQSVVEEVQPLPAVIKSAQDVELDVSPRLMMQEHDVDTRKDNVTPVGTDILVIETASDSWTEIDDANENRFFFRLLKQGEVHTLQGQAPFRLFLGNAPSVQLKINNTPVDISAYIKSNNIAYISVTNDAKVKAAKKIRKVISQDAAAQQPEEIEQNVLSEPVN